VHSPVNNWIYWKLLQVTLPATGHTTPQYGSPTLWFGVVLPAVAPQASDTLLDMVQRHLSSAARSKAAAAGKHGLDSQGSGCNASAGTRLVVTTQQQQSRGLEGALVINVSCSCCCCVCHKHSRGCTRDESTRPFRYIASHQGLADTAGSPCAKPHMLVSHLTTAVLMVLLVTVQVTSCLLRALTVSPWAGGSPSSALR
jgi:hypothetical protein